MILNPMRKYYPCLIGHREVQPIVHTLYKAARMMHDPAEL